MRSSLIRLDCKHLEIVIEELILIENVIHPNNSKVNEGLMMKKKKPISFSLSYLFVVVGRLFGRVLFFWLVVFFSDKTVREN
jgi:hypothetical protein